MAKKKPNILFFFPDQYRFDWLGSNPEIPVRTPNLDRLEHNGVKFTNAICASPLCAPSRAAIASGKEYDRCGVASNQFDYPVDQMTFYKLLRDSGYHVSGCGKFDLHKAAHDWKLHGKYLIDEYGFSDGIDSEGKWDGVNSGKDKPKGPYMLFLEEKRLREIHINDFSKRHKNDAVFPTPLPDEAYSDNWIGNNGLKLMNDFPGGKPWFLQINFTGPHGPWDITEKMKEWYKGIDFPQPVENDQFSKEVHNEIRRNYSAMNENIDRWVGIFLSELEKRNELDNTLIVFSSDHGEMLGDHNRWGKSVPYQPSIGIPLIISGLNTKKGMECNLPTTILDLAGTFLNYAGIKIPSDMDSRSLKPLCEGKTEEHRNYVLSGLNNWRVVYDGRYKLVKGFEEELILFDLKEDPQELNNIADKEPEIVKKLSKYTSI